LFPKRKIKSILGYEYLMIIFTRDFVTILMIDKNVDHLNGMQHVSFRNNIKLKLNKFYLIIKSHGKSSNHTCSLNDIKSQDFRFFKSTFRECSIRKTFSLRKIIFYNQEKDMVKNLRVAVLEQQHRVINKSKQ
jgi:hypothetical protein